MRGCTGSSISSAEYVEDVNRDPVLILNGLTKAFRLPGWRICWILGPEDYINALSSAGSFWMVGQIHLCNMLLLTSCSH